MRPFEYAEPTSVGEVCEILGRHGEDARVIAGGNSLVYFLKRRIVSPRVLVTLQSLPAALCTADPLPGGGLRLGSLMTHEAVATHPLVRERCPQLATTAANIGSVRVRNSGTIGGSLCYAHPAIDTAPVLITLGAEVVIAARGGTRTLPVEQFFSDAFRSVLAPDELLTEIRLPGHARPLRGTYIKFVGQKAKSSMAIVGIAVAIRGGNGAPVEEVQIVLGGVSPTPLRARRAEDLLRVKRATPELLRQVGAAAAAGTAPWDDPWASAGYKRDMVEVLTRQALEGLTGLGPGYRG